jgi:hypothetical protein
MARSKNSNARTGFFTCISCGKRTRHTGEQALGSELCPICWDDAGIENEHSDGFHDEQPDPNCPLCSAAAQEAARLLRESKTTKAKKPKSKKSKKSADPRAGEIAEAWKNGASLAELKSKYSTSRSNLRRLITQAVGGKDEFARLRQAGGGGSRKKSEGKVKKSREGRAAGPQGDDVFTIVPDDAHATIISSARAEDGWQYTRIRGVSIHTSPDGTKYVEARPTEKADLIYHFDETHRSAGLPDVRLRKFEDSSKGKRIKRETKKIEAIAKATEQRAKTKRSARKARKARA